MSDQLAKVRLDTALRKGVISLKEHFLELIRRASTQLPSDVEQALAAGIEAEEDGSRAQAALQTLQKNVALAREMSTPICQDTGTLIFNLKVPRGADHGQFEGAIKEAAKEATAKYYLRPNAVDPVTGKNSGDNTGDGFPPVHFEQWDGDDVRVDLMLKGGGSENVSIQFKLPYAGKTKCGRDLQGVENAVLEAVFLAQGKGCAPGVLGICIGGDMNSGMEAAKSQLFRKLGSKSEDPVLAELESRIMDRANKIGIGPMGFGGKTTILGAHVTKRHRIPATFIVSVAYVCWACRRAGMTIKAGSEVIYDQS